MIRHFPEVNVAQPTVETLVNPRTLPEAGFQSYEMLKSDAVAKKSAFLTGEIRNPDLNHPYLHSLGTMDQGILHLHNAIEQVRRIEPDEEKAGIIATSLEFRMAEMEYIKLLGQLEFLVKEDGAEEDIRELAAQGRELGEHLYGVPDQTIRDAALGEVWSQLDAKQLSLSARKLWRELDQGFEWGGGKGRGLTSARIARCTTGLQSSVSCLGW